MDNARYLEVVQDSRARQGFLNDLRRVEPLPFVNKLVYSPSNYFSWTTRTRPNLVTHLDFKGRKPDILVYPEAFDLDTHKDIVELSSTIFDFEGYKARRAFENPEACGLNWMEIIKTVAIGAAIPLLLPMVKPRIDEKNKNKEIHRFCATLYHTIIAERRGINGKYLVERKWDLAKKAKEIELDDDDFLSFYRIKSRELGTGL